MRSNRWWTLKYFSSVVFVCVLTGALCAQSKASKIDSLKNLLALAKDEREVASLCHQLAAKLNESKPKDALPFADSAIRIAARILDTTLLIDATISRGIALFNLSEYASAMTCQMQALDLARLVNDELRMAACYTNIGRLYSRQPDQHEREKEYYRKSLVIREKYHDKQLPSTYLNMSTAFVSEQNYDSARFYAQKSIDAVADTTDPKILAYSYNTMGSIYFTEKNYANAIVWFEKSKKIKEVINDRRGLISSYANIGESYAMLGEFGTATENLNIALALATSLRNKFLQSEIYFTLSDVYKMQGDYKGAYDMFQMHTLYRDSILDDQKRSEMLELQEKYEVTQKQRENELLKSANDIQAESIRRKDLLNYSVVACLLLALGGGLYTFYAYRQKKKANLEISRQKVELEVRNKEVFDSITYAKRIQYTLLANTELLNKNLTEHFVLFIPKDIVSGDFYWATVAPNNDFYLGTCDSTGHGVPGAFMSLLNISFLNEAVVEKQMTDPNTILDHVRTRLVSSVSKDGAMDGMDGTLLRISNGMVNYAAANNNPVVVRYGVLTELPADKMAVGAGSDVPFSGYEMPCSKGDMVYIFTDGYADQFGGPKGKKFKYRQLYALLETNANKTMEQQQSILRSTLESWRGNLEQVDDICIIGFRI